MSKPIIIAEAGVNHNGSIKIAKKLIDVAKIAGADYVKFQTFEAKKLTTKKAKLADYQKKNLKQNKSQYQMLKKLELKKKDHKNLINYCKRKKIKFLSTAFDLESLEFLVKKCKIDCIKIPSGEITNLPLLEKAASLKKKIFLSTGMSNLSEINSAIKILNKNGCKKKDITVLHCTTNYPAKPDELNLAALKLFKKKFKINVGYSDHSLGILAPIIALSYGASVIEKHFTLNKNFKGPDHKASLEPKELKEMVENIKKAALMIGKELKIISQAEKKNKQIARKSIVAKMMINKGEKFTRFNLTCKRPGNGISPMNWYKIIGKKAKKKFDIDEIIKN
jgi:N,N'-diacetyllegionaminate synthase|tara:strand:- start:675 stop:1682 length:1008 start_codon:yes stop_codon:yes gene_type:complete